ncbi:MAG: hypothetical protein HY391_00145 [Deltaproteobacteria bacterium]|nr:hypothetical protein [Deltaproteobacteria bacterium]
MTKKLPGINIQYPWSQHILSGKKTIETRTYPIPRKFIGQELAIIETPGKEGNFKARIAGIIVFGDSFEYRTKQQFYADSDKHLVTADSAYAWKSGRKFGWPVLRVERRERKLPPGFKKGIIYAKDVEV